MIVTPKADFAALPVEIGIAVQSDGWPREIEIEALITKCVRTIWRRLDLPDTATELSVLLADNAAMQALNAQWRGQHKPTNVLSFPASQMAIGDPVPPLLGDIVLARETIEREADIDAKTFTSHLTHLIVHGILHLLGYDHAEDTQAEHMERLERAILTDLGIDDPYRPVLDN